MSNWNDLSAAAQQKAQQIYQILLSFYNNPAGVSAMMGNIWHESGGTFDGRILQGYHESDLNGYCQDYTEDVNDGTISRYDFVHSNNPNGNGYGLCQWTDYGRKGGLYDYNLAGQYNDIGDNVMQLYYLDIELQDSYYSPSLNAILTADENTIDSATETILLNFFAPLDPSVSLADRQQDAREVYNNCSGLPPIPPGPIPGAIDILILKHYIDKNHKKGYII